MRAARRGRVWQWVGHGTPYSFLRMLHSSSERSSRPPTPRARAWWHAHRLVGTLVRRTPTHHTRRTAPCRARDLVARRRATLSAETRRQVVGVWPERGGGQGGHNSQKYPSFCVLTDVADRFGQKPTYDRSTPIPVTDSAKRLVPTTSVNRSLLHIYSYELPILPYLADSTHAVPSLTSAPRGEGANRV